jgi:hypothetical protein
VTCDNSNNHRTLRVQADRLTKGGALRLMRFTRATDCALFSGWLALHRTCFDLQRPPDCDPYVMSARRRTRRPYRSTATARDRIGTDRPQTGRFFRWRPARISGQCYSGEGALITKVLQPQRATTVRSFREAASEFCGLVRFRTSINILSDDFTAL